MRPCFRRRSNQRGFVAIAYAVMIVGIMGFAGLAVDTGYLHFEKSRLQAAADAAAIGALRELERGQTDLTAAGQNDASLNGFANRQNDTTVTINNPPTGGTYVNDSAAVEAIVQRKIPTFFMRIFGQNSVTISTHAVALTKTAQGSIGGCIFALNPAASAALEISGNQTNSLACNALVNSNSSTAYVQSGSSQVHLAKGAKVGVVGPGTAGSGWTFDGAARLTNATNAQAELPENIQSFDDPLANVAAPTPSAIAGDVQSSSALNVDRNHMPANNELHPGVYCGGIKIQSTSGTLTLNSGVYVLAGGGMTINAQAALTGTGVMFYNTTSTSESWGCHGNSAAQSITMKAGAQLNLTAPTGQSPIGVLFLEDRNVSGLNNEITGNSASTFNGALYFRNSRLTFAGTGGAGQANLVMVADTIKITSALNLGNDYSSLANVYTIAPPSTGGVLVE